MNIRKNVDYTELFAALCAAVDGQLSQMELYCEIGRIVNVRKEKGAAVAAAEYLTERYPEAAGFSPRNLLRMREFYRSYETTPEVLQQAMQIGWTYNVVIMEAELSLQDKAWYIQAVRQFGWSKTELLRRIESAAHIEMSLDTDDEVCYTDTENTVVERSEDDKDTLCVSGEHLPESDGGICNEGSGEESRSVEAISNRVSRNQPCRWSSLSPGPAETGRAWNQLQGQDLPPASEGRLRRLRPFDRDGLWQSAQYAPYLRRRSRGKDAFASGLHRLPQRYRRSMVHRRFRNGLEGCGERVSGTAEAP